MNSGHVAIRETAVVKLSREGISSRSVPVIVSFPGYRLIDCLLRSRGLAIGRTLYGRGRLDHDGQRRRQTDLVLGRTVVYLILGLNASN